MQDRFKCRVWNELSSIMSYEVCIGNFFQRTNLHKEIFDWISVSYGKEFISYKGDALKYLILMQCTGWRDRNDKLIYESDIVSDGFDKYVVEWSGSDAQFNFKDLSEKLNIVYTKEQLLPLKIVGNIYENKELLCLTQI